MSQQVCFNKIINLSLGLPVFHSLPRYALDYTNPISELSFLQAVARRNLIIAILPGQYAGDCQRVR